MCKLCTLSLNVQCLKSENIWSTSLFYIILLLFHWKIVDFSPLLLYTLVFLFCSFSMNVGDEYEMEILTHSLYIIFYLNNDIFSTLKKMKQFSNIFFCLYTFFRGHRSKHSHLNSQSLRTVSGSKKNSISFKHSITSKFKEESFIPLIIKSLFFVLVVESTRISPPF